MSLKDKWQHTIDKLSKAEESFKQKGRESFEKIEECRLEKDFHLPGSSCEVCNEDLFLHIETQRANINALIIYCKNCQWKDDLIAKAGDVYIKNRDNLKKQAKHIADSVLKLKHLLPKDKEELIKVIQNPKHPFTATLLTGIVILLMELSGFGVFMAVTWILGNLILNPLGWVLIPVVVGIAFAYRQKFNRDSVDILKGRLKELDEKREKGLISEDEYAKERELLLSEFFK